MVMAAAISATGLSPVLSRRRIDRRLASPSASNGSVAGRREFTGGRLSQSMKRQIGNCPVTVARRLPKRQPRSEQGAQRSQDQLGELLVDASGGPGVGGELDAVRQVGLVD